MRVVLIFVFHFRYISLSITDPIRTLFSFFSTYYCILGMYVLPIHPNLQVPFFNNTTYITLVVVNTNFPKQNKQKAKNSCIHS
jgi:hypothetical protein